MSSAARLATLLLVLLLPGGATLAEDVSVEGILATAKFDITGTPSSVPSAKKIRALWNVHKTAKECFKFPVYAPTTPLKLKIYKPEELANLIPRSPFPAPVAGSEVCNSPSLGKGPKPILTVKLNEDYGRTDGAVDMARSWFAYRLAGNRFRPAGESASALRETLIAWADAKAFRMGINVSWGAKPIDWQMNTFITALTIAYAETSAQMTPEERAKVGTWLNPLLANVARSRWQHSDDHDTTAALPVLVWGLTVGDVAAIQWAIDVYKKQIHLMRPDGSFPVDGGRGAAGLLYNSQAAGNLVMMGAIVRSGLGLDLLGYTVDGRSIHTAVDFVVRTMNDPGGMNKLYALPCPNGGDLKGSIDAPRVFWMSGSGSIMNSSFLGAYANYFPEQESSKWISFHMEILWKQFKYYHVINASPVCMMNATSRPSVE